MKRRLLGGLLALASLCGASEQHIWYASRQPRFDDATRTLYGITVLMESDDPDVTGFIVTIHYRSTEGWEFTLKGPIVPRVQPEEASYTTTFAANTFEDLFTFTETRVEVQEVR